MVVIVFRARIREESLPALAAAGERMYELASAMPGFLSYKDFAAEDGESVSVIEFESLEHVTAWRDHPEHREVQSLGRSDFFSEFTIQVCEEVRATRFP